MNAPRAKSLTARLTLLFAAVSGAVLLALGLVVGHLVERHFAELDAETLNAKLALVRHALLQVRSPDDLPALRQLLDAALVGEHELSIRIRGAGGQLLYASADADLPRGAPGDAIGRAPHLANARDGHRLRMLTADAALGGAAGSPALVELATHLTHHEAFAASFRTALWTTVVLAAFASGMLGWAVARRGLAPLRTISRDAARITAQRLDRRVPAAALPAELAEVAQAVNHMLARLEESFRRLTEFSSDLAHELRTPVNNLLTQTQVTLSKGRSVEEYREVLASNAEEFERLSRTIADMLFLAKADNDMIVPHREPIDLRAEADAIAEFYAPVADENGVALSVEGDARAEGDRLMLRRAVGNLLSNACRHTPPGGNITVQVQGPQAGYVSLAVRNTGSTVAPEHLPHLFDRFYRADPSRSREAEGAGLGLAITRSILRAHGGEATVRSADGITVFELRLPA